MIARNNRREEEYTVTVKDSPVCVMDTQVDYLAFALGGWTKFFDNCCYYNLKVCSDILQTICNTILSMYFRCFIHLHKWEGVKPLAQNILKCPPMVVLFN